MSRSAREEHEIRLQPDLIIPTEDAASEALFHNARDLAVDASGHIYVLDGGNRRVLIFDSDGAFLRTLGGAGQGPGEFVEPNVMGISDGFLVVGDGNLLRASVWSASGGHVEDWRYEFPNYLDAMVGVEGQSVLTSYRMHHSTASEGSGEWILLRVGVNGLDRAELARLVDSPKPAVGRSIGTGAVLRRHVELPYLLSPMFAAATDTAYVVPSGEYRVMCFDVDGKTRWDLHVDWPRREFDEQDKEDALASLPGRFADASASDVNWPTLHPAISHVAVDGRGNLHTFLVPQDSWPVDRVPIDVYAPDGTRLIAGVSDAHKWTAARGDHVYALTTDASSGEQVVVRYRLILPESRGPSDESP